MNKKTQRASGTLAWISLLPILFLAVFVSNPAKAQNSARGSDNFLEIRKEMNEYWKNHEITKGCGYKPYKRWEWYWEQRTGRQGIFPAGDIIYRTWEKYISENPSDQPFDTSANWTPMGPFTTASGYAGLGRVNCIAFHPTNANTFWVGSPSGGLWKTTNYGQSWTTAYDASPVLGVSDILINPGNPQIMYIATGDGDGGSLASVRSLKGGDNSSVGVLKSVNGGSSWTVTGLSWSASDQAMIRRIIMHPTNENIIFAATTKGIYKTTDGGSTWARKAEGFFMDITFNKGNPSKMYAATAYVSGSAGQVYRSTDDGESWAAVTSFSAAIRVILAVTPVQPDLVEAVCTNSSGGLEGMYRSTDGGENFARFFTVTTNCSNNLLNSYAYPAGKSNPCSGQGSYDLCYIINPSNAAERWLGGVNTWKSQDTGKTWSLANYWDPDSTQYRIVHADKHWFAFHPLETGTFFEGNDGGIYYTKNGGSSFTDISNGLQIGQIYKIANAYTNPDIVSGGFQDNGSQVYNSGNWLAPNSIGGDGMMCRIDYVNPLIKYASYAEGVIYRTQDPSWNPTITISDSIPGKPKGSWITPFILDPKTPAKIFAGYRNIYCSANRGDSWQKVTSFGTPDPADDTLIRSLAICQSRPDRQYAASKYNLYKTSNAWSSHTLIDSGLPVDSCVITSVTVHPSRPDTVYVTFSGYNNGKKVYRTYNGGTSWQNISLNLPNIPVNCLVYQDSSEEGVYAGTDLGVWFTNSNMTSWIRYSQGLPNVVVTDLDIHYMRNKIRAATYGRGLWESNLYIAAGRRQINAVDIPVTGGDVKGDGVFTPGETAVLTATPENGWKFTGWFENGGKVSDSSVYSFVVTDNRNLTGMFETHQGMNSLNKDDILILPNPSQGKIEARLSRELAKDLIGLRITDVMGRIILEERHDGSAQNLVLDLSSRGPGNFMLTFFFREGGKITCSLIVVK